MANEPINIKQQSALERAVRMPELRPILFSEVNGLNWFDAFKDKGFIRPEEIPEPVQSKDKKSISIPVWPITEYLANSSKLLNEPDNEEYCLKYLTFIRATTNHAKKNKLSNYRVWWKFSVILKNLPISLLTKKDITLIRYWLDDPYESSLVIRELSSWIEILLKSDDAQSPFPVIPIIQTFLKTKFEPKYSSSDYKQIRFKSDQHALNDFFEKHSCNIGSVLGKTYIDILIRALEVAIKKEKFDNYSAMSRPSIGKSEQNSFDSDAIQIMISSLRDSLIGLIDSNHENSQEYLLEIFSNKFKTIKRIALYVFNEKYEIFESKYFDKVINLDIFDVNLQHETWHFLNNHYAKLNKKRQNKIQNYIDISEEDNSKEESKAYYKSIWYSAIKDADKSVLKKYNQLITLSGTEPDHPDFPHYMKSGWVGQKSPYSLSELGKKRPKELVTLLNNYKAERTFDGPTVEGLAKEFRQFIKSKVGSRPEELNTYADLNYPYLYEFFEAYKEVWLDKASIQYQWDEIWPIIFSFIKSLLASQAFKNEKEIKDKTNEDAFVGNQQWVIGSIAQLIESGCQNKEKTFDESLINTALPILTFLLKIADGYKATKKGDAVTSVINNPRGKCIEAIINLALHSARCADDKKQWKEHEWDKFKAVFENELIVDNHGFYDFATLSIMYLPNFKYLSDDWAIDLPEKLFSKTDETMWWCSMQGFAFLNHFMPDLFKYMEESGDIVKALDHPDLEEKVCDRIIDFILIAYINDTEALDDESLVTLLLQRNKTREIKRIINFFWRSRGDNIEQKIINKVYELWPEIISVIDFSTDEGKQIASQLCHWSCYIDILDEEKKEWLMKIASYAEVGYNSHDLIESIERLGRENPRDAYDVWSEMLKMPSFPYPEETIKKALENLIQDNIPANQYADLIVKLYASHGSQAPLQWLAQIKK